jgi:hypothetical protein
VHGNFPENGDAFPEEKDDNKTQNKDGDEGKDKKDIFYKDFFLMSCHDGCLPFKAACA